MNKKTLKIITTIITFIMIISMGVSVFAADKGGLLIDPSNMTGNSSAAGTDKLQDFGGKLMGVLQTAGVVVAVVILIVLGIKYMMGSASEKAEYKKTMIPYIVGAILIFAASTVANIVYNFAQGLK